MTVPVEVPALGESITEAIVAEWLKSEGDFVEQDEVIVELETDKITVSVPSPVAGVLSQVMANLDDTVNVGDVIAEIDPDQKASSKPAEKSGSEKADAKTKDKPEEEKAEPKQPEKQDRTDDDPEPKRPEKQDRTDGDETHLSPAVARLVEEHDLNPSSIKATGPGGRLLKGDVLEHVESKGSKEARSTPPAQPQAQTSSSESVERVRMSKLRQTVAKRLVEAQQTAAILTTFNEVDMSAVMQLRKSYQDSFVKRYDIKLGFMSFFVKAAIEALKEFPAVNAEIDGNEIVYKNYYHIGVAVGGPKGLVVPVVRNADQLSFAEVEGEISRLARAAMDNKLGLEDLQGGTFTISNGGIYGSMLSTPILNPPQVGILGMHNITERAVVIDGKVEVRPMMYLALSYDHRIIDGKEAVSFLVRLKECIENPERILLEV